MLSPSRGMDALLKNSSDVLVAEHSVSKDGPTEFHWEWGGIESHLSSCEQHKLNSSYH